MEYDRSRNEMSNTLALEAFIMRHGKDKALAEPAIDLFEAFARNHKIRGTQFSLMSESQLRPDKPRIAEIMSGVLGREVEVSFVGLQQLREGGRSEQVRLYQMIDEAGPMHRLLPYKDLKVHYSKLKTSDEDTLEDLVALSLGAHRLRPIFDETFGHDFSRLIRWNIEGIWYCYCSHILEGNVDKASKFGAAGEFLTKTTPVGLLPTGSGLSKGERPALCMFVDANDAADVGKPTVSLERAE